MNTAEYLKALKRLKLTPSGKATSAALGVSVRQLQDYSSGRTAPIPKPIAIILQLRLEALANARAPHA